MEKSSCAPKGVNLRVFLEGVSFLPVSAPKQIGTPESASGAGPYHTSASGLHSKMLLVNGLKCSQGKSANWSRNLGICVGSRGSSRGGTQVWGKERRHGGCSTTGWPNPSGCGCRVCPSRSLDSSEKVFSPTGGLSWKSWGSEKR